MTEHNPDPQVDNNLPRADYAPNKLLTKLREQAATPKPDELPAKLARQAIRQEPLLFQPRAMNERHISELASTIRQKGKLDPVTVIQVGNDPILIDGHHRMAAYKRAKVDADIPVTYFVGSIDEAVLEAGNANSKAKLPMTNQDRQNYAWRLVILQEFSKRAICDAAGISDGQVAVMRRLAKQLGSDALTCQSWWQAHQMAKGNVRQLMDDNELEQFKEAQARNYAERLSKMFYNKLTNNPEIAAMALELHFGNKLTDLYCWLGGRLPDDDDENDDF